MGLIPEIEKMRSPLQGNDDLHRLDACLSVNGSPRRPVSLLCLTTGLEYGGAEMMLYKFLSRMDKTRFTAQVISMIELGPFSRKIQELGVPLRSLGMNKGVPDPIGLIRLIRWLREVRPDVIQTWMYHADLIGGLAAKLAGGIPVAWNIRHTDLRAGSSRRLTIYTMRMCAQLSNWLPTKIVCCSEASRKVHSALGYAAQKMVVIPNGLDLTLFRPDSAARESVRKELNVSDHALIIGIVGRFDPQKDHRNFIQAAALLSCDGMDVHFLFCGDDMTWNNPELASWFRGTDIRERCHLLGRRDDIPRLTAALDIACVSSSFGEGFPNVIGEAMSCEIPCVVTDVGDSALIVGKTGRVVPPRDAKALAASLRELIDLGWDGRKKLGAAARNRVKEHYAQHCHFPVTVAQDGLNLLARDRVVVVVRSVDQLVVRARAQPVDIELRALHKASRKHPRVGYARQREDEVDGVKSRDRQLDDLALFERVCSRAVLLL
jgi:glycosyltransferase involved in cell wall biosynthesis